VAEPDAAGGADCRRVAVSRGGARADACRASLQGSAPALAIGQIGQFGIHDGASGAMLGASFEEQYAAAADSVLKARARKRSKR
jgi:hypothetical protein